MIKAIIVSITIIVFLSSCEKEILQQSNPEEIVVVEAYLYDGEPVDDIYLTSLLTYGGKDTVVQKISDAVIEIIHNNNHYPLVASDEARYYHYEGTDLEISVIGFGAWAIGGWMWGGTNVSESIKAIYSIPSGDS